MEDALGRKGEWPMSLPIQVQICECGHIKAQHRFTNSTRGDICGECRCNQYAEEIPQTTSVLSPDVVASGTPPNSDSLKYWKYGEGRLLLEQFWYRRLSFDKMAEILAEMETKQRPLASTGDTPQPQEWKVVAGDEADNWGIRKAGESYGKSIAQMLWENDAKHIVNLHNAALGKTPDAREEKEK